MSKLDTNHVVNLDLVKDRVNSVIKFGLADVETSDFFVGLYNNGSRVFDKDYIVTLYIVKPNGTFRNIKLEPKEGLKKYYCNLPDTLKNIAGEYVCQVMVFDNLTGEKKISKSKFKYSVSVDLASEMAGIIDEEEQESILTNILNRLLTLENPVEPYATQKHVDKCVSTLTEEIDTIKVKDVEQDGKLVDIESKNTEQDERLNTLENKVDGIGEKIVDTIEPSLDNYGNRLNTLENKDIVHESRMTDIESKNVEQDNRLTSIEGINTTQNNRLDALETKDIAHESRMANIESKNTEQDNRLNSLESKDLIHESRITNIESKNTEQDDRLSNIETKNVEQDSRLDVAENRLANIGNDITNTMQPIIDEHTSRLDAIEVKNQQQDDRLLDIEKVNKRQDMNLKCLFAESKNNMIDIAEEGNSIYLQNSTTGCTLIDEIKGNTLVNCNKEPDKELILNGNINTSGDNTVTITEGVDGGLVDVALEGNTLVNVSKTKDSTALPLEEELTYLYANTQYTVQFVSDEATTADVTLGGTQLLAQSIVKGLNRISITTPSELVDNKLVIDGVGANISEVVVTDTDREFGYFEGMKSVGEGGNLVITSNNRDNTLSNVQQLSHEPLRAVGSAKDRYVLIDGKWYIERNCKEVIFDGSDDESWSYFSISGNNSNTWVFGCSINYFGYANSYYYPLQSDKLGTIAPKFDYNKEMIYGNRYGYGRIWVHLFSESFGATKSTPSAEGVALFKQYLSKNPITVVGQLMTPTCEPIDYNPLEVYSDVTHISTNSAIPTNITVKNHGFNCLLKPSTTYTISSKLGLNTVTTRVDIGDSCLRFMDTDTSDVATMKDVLILEGDWTSKPDLIPANFSGMESAFEQGYDAEKGKYKVNVRVTNEDKTKENNITFYIDEPLRGVENSKDKVYVKDDKVIVQRNCGIRPYEDGDFGIYPTDKIDTVYQLAEPTYEEVEYNDTKLFIESFKNSTLFYNSNVPVTSKLYYSYSVPIVDTVAKTASISDEQDVMIIDLATQVAVMEMMLM